MILFNPSGLGLPFLTSFPVMIKSNSSLNFLIKKLVLYLSFDVNRATL